MVLSVLLSVLILSCDPDEAKKKPSENNTTQDNQDDNQDQNDNNDNQTNKPPEKIPATKLTRTKSTLPVASLGTISSKTVANDGGEDARTKADTSGKSLGWVFQDKEIIFSTSAKDKNGNEIPKSPICLAMAQAAAKRPRPSFGRTWTEITGQTTATATLTIPADERVGAYQLRVSATSGGEKADNHKETPYKFTVRKSGCPAPSTTNQPAIYTELEALIQKPLSLTDTQLQAIDTSNLTFLGTPFTNNQSLDKDISCWDVSNLNNMSVIFFDSSAFNQDIGDWDTSEVTIMISAFRNAAKFNQDLSGWDVSKVSSHLSFDRGATAWEEANKPDWPKTP